MGVASFFMMPYLNPTISGDQLRAGENVYGQRKYWLLL
jgi:hypothetical protein